MSLILSNNSNNIKLPKECNQINWKSVFGEVDYFRSNAFSCSKSGDLVKLRPLQSQIFGPPATLLTAICRITSKSTRETWGALRLPLPEDNID
jgi:hypothetical protein